MADSPDAASDEKLSNLLAPLREEMTPAEPVPPSILRRAELLDAAVAARGEADIVAAAAQNEDAAAEPSHGGPVAQPLAVAASR